MPPTVAVPTTGPVYSERIVRLVVETKGIQQQADATARSLGAIEKSINAVKNAFYAFGAFKAAEVFRDVVDSAVAMNNILSTLNKTGDETIATQAQLFAVSNQSRT